MSLPQALDAVQDFRHNNVPAQLLLLAVIWLVVVARKTPARPWSGWARLEEAAERIDRWKWLTFVLLTVLFVLNAARDLHRPTWYDELTTFYIAQAPSFSRFLQMLSRFDLNPPLSYGLVRLSQEIFRPTIRAMRLPSALEFLAASGLVFYYLQARVGALWSAAAILMFWNTAFFIYASEGRPYALLLFVFSLALVGYDLATENRGRPRRWALAMTAAGCSGMMLSHSLAPIFIFPFCLAELTRVARTRKIDWPVWACLLLPLSLVAQYIRLMQGFQQMYFPPEFQASVRQMVGFFVRVLPFAIIELFLIGGALSRYVSRLAPATVVTATAPRKWTREDAALFAGVLAAPVIVNLAFMRSHGAFWDRYCIPTVFLMASGVVIGLASFAERKRSAALPLLALLLMAFFARSFEPMLQVRRGVYDNIAPDLPLVTASGLTFMSMNYYEKNSFLSRVYYLADRESAIKYANATIFEGLPQMVGYFPIRAHFAAYGEFIASHPHFLVLGNIDYPEDWLLRKLKADHASVKLIGRIWTHYKDQELYDVNCQTASITSPH